jgi:hypothetical protein
MCACTLGACHGAGEVQAPALAVIEAQTVTVNTPRIDGPAETVFRDPRSDLRMAVTRTGTPEGHISVRRSVTVDGASDVRVAVITQNEQGDVLLVRLDEVNSKSSIKLDPPLVLVPARLAPKVEGSTVARVSRGSIAGGRELSGTATIVHTPEMTEPATVPAGADGKPGATADAATPRWTGAWRSVMTISVGPSVTSITSTVRYEGARGLVAETRQVVVKLLGVPLQREDEQWELVEGGAARGEQPATAPARAP